MKLSYILFFLIFNLIGVISIPKIQTSGLKAQSVGIYNQTVSISPSYTLGSGSTFSAIGSVVNTGSNSFSNKIDVYLAIDTSSTSTPKLAYRSTTTYSVTNFAPGQTFSFSVSDVITPANGYKVNGGGTTVIIWPIVGSVTNTISTNDSVFTYVFIDLTSGLNDINSPLNDIFIQNPSHSVIEIDASKTKLLNIYVELISSEGQVITTKEINGQLNSINLPHLQNGMYFLRFIDRQTQNKLTKKIIISN